MSGWTDDNWTVAQRMWLDGASLSEIAARIGMTRNQVAGRVFRAGFRRGRVPSATPRACRPKKITRPPSPPRVIAPPPPGPQPVVSLAYARPFMSRASRECAWLLDDGRSCCARVEGAGSYCAGHRALVYRPTAKLDGEKMARRFG